MALTPTMKAIVVHQFGGPEVLKYDDIPRPVPGPGEVLIRIHAAGVNPPDWYARAGFAMIPPEFRPKLLLPFIPGSDVSGVVEAVGPEVSEFHEGDAVFGLVRFPQLNNGGKAYSEYTTAPQAHLARKPENLDHVHAAAVPMSGLTAYQYLFDICRLDSGHTVLVNGAAGGVGHFTVQLAKFKGSKVIGVASDRHEAFLRALGIDEFVDYTTTAIEDKVHDVDLIVDTVGGPNGYRFLPVLKRGGMISPVFWGDFHAEQAAEMGIAIQGGQVHSDGAQMTVLADLLDVGKIRVAIDSIFSLADASKAHERGERGHLQGKIVLRVAD